MLKLKDWQTNLSLHEICKIIVSSSRFTHVVLLVHLNLSGGTWANHGFSVKAAGAALGCCYCSPGFLIWTLSCYNKIIKITILIKYLHKYCCRPRDTIVKLIHVLVHVARCWWQETCWVTGVSSFRASLVYADISTCLNLLRTCRIFTCSAADLPLSWRERI